jgi:hypothetical protein
VALIRVIGEKIKTGDYKLLNLTNSINSNKKIEI